MRTICKKTPIEIEELMVRLVKTYVRRIDMIVQINTCAGIGSTGRIMKSLSEEASNYGMSSLMVCSNESESDCNTWYTQTKSQYYWNNICSRLFGNEGSVAYKETRSLLRKFDEIKIDLIHIHNLHGHYIHSGLLFDYIKKNSIPTVWTLHDCWAFTGHCPNFDSVNCKKWIHGCDHCPQLDIYPKCYIDYTNKMWRHKKAWFTNVKNMVIVTPSEWMAKQVSSSFLKDYPIKVIHNGINLTIFKPVQSDFRDRYFLHEKYILLGVAFGWGERKGLDVFIELAKALDDRFQIVLVGTDQKMDKILPTSIISIHRTKDLNELVELYSEADLFVNPTREDNFPTVNIEALACGTPVVTFDTGGSPEIIDKTCGDVIPRNDIEKLINRIKEIYINHQYNKESCVNRARYFDQHKKYKEYVELYKEMIT